MLVMSRGDEWLTTGEAARRLGVSTRTMRRYTDTGVLPDNRSEGGRRIFSAVDVARLAGSRGRADRLEVVLYARVSSRRQQAEGDLDRQVTRLVAEADQYGTLVGTFTDVASGLSDRRHGLKRALTACQSGQVGVLLVTHRDRLARFGVGVIEHLLAGHGVRVVYVGEERSEEVSTAEAELVADLVAIVASFAGRLYGQRSARARRLTEAVEREIADG